jgi:hypothetical protein
MKKLVNVGIGGSSFVIEEDAYQNLICIWSVSEVKGYPERSEVMEDVEQRIAELFYEYTKGKAR